MNFSDFKIDEFESDQANPAVYGIRPYKNYLQIKTKNAIKILRFGREKTGKVYCAVVGNNAIYKVFKYKFDQLNKKIEDFLPTKRKKMNLNKKMPKLNLKQRLQLQKLLQKRRK